MADNFTANPGSGGDTFAADDVAGVKVPYSKLDIGADGVSSPVTAANPLPVSGSVSVSNMVAQGLTDLELRASAVPVSLTSTTVTGTVATSQADPVATLTGSGSLTGTPQAVTLPLNGRANATFQLSGTFVATLQFEASNNGTDWTTIFALRAGDNIIATTATVPDIYRCTTSGFAQARVICTAYTSGTVVVTARANADASGVFLNFPLPPGSNTIGTVNAVEQALNLVGQSGLTATVNNILENPTSATATDVSNYRAASVQVVSTGTAGTFIFEQSNDNVNFVALPVFNSALVTGVPITAAITATVSQIIYTIPIRCRYVRLRIATTITGGTIQAFSRVSTEPWTPTATLVASNTAANNLAQVSGTVTANIGTGSIAAGTNAIGDVGIQYRANATGAATTFKFASAATVNNALVLTGARRLIGYSLTNTTASFKYFRFYNKATAPTSGESPTFMVGLPPNSTTSYNLPGGIALSLGLGVACTGGVTDTDATVTAVNDVVGSVQYA